jgi:hypothetical protein
LGRGDRLAIEGLASAAENGGSPRVAEGLNLGVHGVFKSRVVPKRVNTEDVIRDLGEETLESARVHERSGFQRFAHVSGNSMPRGVPLIGTSTIVL